MRRPLKCLYPLEISCEDAHDPETVEEKGTEVMETPTVEEIGSVVYLHV